MKLLLWSALALIVVVWLFRHKKISGGSDAAANARAARQPHAEPIVQCAHCGMHVPASEAWQSAAGQVFCSREHRLQHGAS